MTIEKSAAEAEILNIRRMLGNLPESILMELVVAPCSTPEEFDARTAARIILFAKRELTERCLPAFRL